VFETGPGREPIGTPSDFVTAVSQTVVAAVAPETGAAVVVVDVRMVATTRA
jgi:hypothetical protein